MTIQNFSFGSVQIDGIEYKDDVVIDGGEIRQREKKPSRKFRDSIGHTPLSLRECIPWQCRRLVIGTGVDGKLPVMPDVVQEAKRRRVELIVIPTPCAIEELQKNISGTNAILHLTC
jgi:hypothetical protein